HRQPQLLEYHIEHGPQADTGTTGERLSPHLGVDVFEQGRCDRSLSARIPQRRQIPTHSALSIVNDPPPGKSDTALAPADSRPKTTISMRGTSHFSTVADETSTPIQSRPILCATAAVVPDPAKKSSTVSPASVATAIIRWIRRSGFGVENTR